MTRYVVGDMGDVYPEWKKSQEEGRRSMGLTEERKRFSDNELRAMRDRYTVGRQMFNGVIDEALARGAALVGAERERDDLKEFLTYVARSPSSPATQAHVRQLEEENAWLRAGGRGSAEAGGTATMTLSEALRRLANKRFLSRDIVLFLWEVGAIDSAEKNLLYSLITHIWREAREGRSMGLTEEKWNRPQRRLSDDEIRGMLDDWERTITAGPPGIYLLVDEALARGVRIRELEKEKARLPGLRVALTLGEQSLEQAKIMWKEAESRANKLEEENIRLRAAQVEAFLEAERHQGRVWVGSRYLTPAQVQQVRDALIVAAEQGYQFDQKISAALSLLGGGEEVR